MNPSKSFYGETLFTRNKRSYGLHPKCKKCLTLKEKKCSDPQYRAINMGDFFCADYKD